MTFSDLVLILALIGCFWILYKKRKERKEFEKSRKFVSSKTRVRRPVKVKL